VAVEDMVDEIGSSISFHINNAIIYAVSIAKKEIRVIFFCSLTGVGVS
jgi:hypothetical protein